MVTESILSDEKLHAELDFFKRHVDLIATQKIKYPADFVPPIEQRPRKPTLANIPVCEPPEPATEEKPAKSEDISLTIKSLKPPLSFTLLAPPTASISSLKKLLAEQESSAPQPDAQRWILKGKAMGDTKLLREFSVESGAVVNLMIKLPASNIATPAVATSTLLSSAAEPVTPPLLPISPSGQTTTSRRSSSIDGPLPSLTVSTPEQSSISAGGTPASPSITTSVPDSAFQSHDYIPSSNAQSDHFISTIAKPELWKDALEVLYKHFGEDSMEAKKCFEAWLSGSRDWITPSDKALIRERTGISAMGGL